MDDGSVLIQGLDEKLDYDMNTWDHVLLVGLAERKFQPVGGGSDNGTVRGLGVAVGEGVQI